MISPGIPYGVFEKVSHPKELGHRFRGAAGLCDDVKDRAAGLDHIQQGCHAFRVDIILNIELGAFAFCCGKVVIPQVRKRLLDGNRAKRAAANAKYHKSVTVCPYPGSRFQYGRDHLCLIERKFAPLHFAALFFHANGGSFICFPMGIERFRCNAMFSGKIAHHVAVIHVEPHGITPFFAFKAFHKR